jgi:hypothetical protein
VTLTGMREGANRLQGAVCQWMMNGTDRRAF